MERGAGVFFEAVLLWKYEETCKPGTRGPGLVTGGGLPITFNKEDCVVIHGNRQWKSLRLGDDCPGMLTT